MTVGYGPSIDPLSKSPYSNQSFLSRQAVLPNLHPSMDTLDQKLSRSLTTKVYQKQQMENSSQCTDQGGKLDQALISLKIELAQTQESVKALSGEKRYLKDQLNRWKGKVRLLHSVRQNQTSALETKIHELVESQKDLNMELQGMREEIKNITKWNQNQKVLKERSVQTESCCSSLKSNAMKYLKYNSLDLPSPCVRRKWILKQQGDLLTRNSGGSPEVTVKSEFPQSASFEVAYAKNTKGGTGYSGELKPEADKDLLKHGIKITNPNCYFAVEELSKRQMEEEELQQLVSKLNDTLSFQIQTDHSSALKKRLLSTAEHVSKSFSDLISHLTLTAKKCGDSSCP